MANSQLKDDNNHDKKTAIAVQDADFTSEIMYEEATEIDETYLGASWFTKLYRGVLLQMILFGA